ncbi:kinase-like domain-containing protein [Amanita rubescens]|nr:kinase-like domain-containing protein [Amanita rubescens]
MLELVSKKNIIPKSLFVTDVKTAKMTVIGIGGFGRVFKGAYKGLPVALKVVDRGHTNNSLSKDFCQEALTWKSLSHHFILPLLGIFEEGSQLFLVSPFMANGTLTGWRKTQQEPIKINEIHRVVGLLHMLEVAEGVKYLHSEGIVHGDLHGHNVLLNSEFHCQITDFGSTRHFEAIVTRSTTAFAINFVAPELFGMCTTCDFCLIGALIQDLKQTFFGSVPFHDKTDIQILRLVTNGKRPDRLESPRMEDDTWHLIQRCWESIPSKRSTIKDIAAALA